MFSLRHEFPNEWHSLKQSNSSIFTLTKQHLPQFTREHNPSTDSVIWFARVNGDPESFKMSLGETDFTLTQEPSLNNLCVGSSNSITLGTEFALSATDAADLEELVLLIKYTLSS